MCLVYVRRNFFWTSINKRLKCLQAIFPQFIVIFVTILNNQWHNAFYLLAESVTCLSTVINLDKSYSNLLISSLIIHIQYVNYLPDRSNALDIGTYNIFSCLSLKTFKKMIQQLVVQIIIARCQKVTQRYYSAFTDRLSWRRELW